MADVRLVNRDTGSVVVVSEDKADALLLNYRLEREDSKKPAKKAAAKRSTSK
jgi:hypothetical protein